MAKQKNDSANEKAGCPVGRFFMMLEKASGRRSKVMEHLSRSHVEFLKALKCLIDERIEDLEKEDTAGGRKKTTRIRVQ